MQTGSSETLIGWKSGETSYVPNGRSMAIDYVIIRVWPESIREKNLLRPTVFGVKFFLGGADFCRGANTVDSGLYEQSTEHPLCLISTDFLSPPSRPPSIPLLVR